MNANEIRLILSFQIRKEIVINSCTESARFLTYVFSRINTKDSKNNTALHIAAEFGNLEIVKFLLERGADVNAKNKNKLTPIWTMESDDYNEPDNSDR